MEAIKEANRYLDNAVHILQKNAKAVGFLYTDPKYVRIASNAAYMAALVALSDYVVNDNKKSSTERPKQLSINEYHKFLKEADFKQNQYLTLAYDILHKSGSYGGISSKQTIDEGIQAVREIIKFMSTYKPKKKIGLS